ncbi:unnamed protein product [Linum tenue]|uniref:Uncharacterized protein n=1 Tax=Linum tenue TaxID=586396 RepID=A0AAV0KMT7_9ROSI|nr:unnamed protein product [Linum tenue]
MGTSQEETSIGFHLREADCTCPVRRSPGQIWGEKWRIHQNYQNSAEAWGQCPHGIH